MGGARRFHRICRTHDRKRGTQRHKLRCRATDSGVLPSQMSVAMNSSWPRWFLCCSSLRLSSLISSRKRYWPILLVSFRPSGSGIAYTSFQVQLNSSQLRCWRSHSFGSSGKTIGGPRSGQACFIWRSPDRKTPSHSIPSYCYNYPLYLITWNSQWE
jgi:hypothetical protein